MRWLGNAGFEIASGHTVLLIDPFLSRPPIQKVLIGAAQPDMEAIHSHIHDGTHILVSHTHFDHFMDTPEISSFTGARIYGSSNTCRLSKVLGVPAGQITEIRPGDTWSADAAEIEAIPAAHPWIPGYGKGKINENLQPPLHLRDYRMDTCMSFLIKTGDRRVLVWSSTRTDHAVPADVLICRAVSGQAWYDRMLKTVNPELVIPSHWDDIFQPLSEPGRPFFTAPRLGIPPLERINLDTFSRRIKLARPECSVLIPERFREYEIAGHIQKKVETSPACGIYPVVQSLKKRKGNHP